MRGFFRFPARRRAPVIFLARALAGALAVLLAACASALPPQPTAARTSTPSPTGTPVPTAAPLDDPLPVTGFDPLRTPLPTFERYDPLSPTMTAIAQQPTRALPTIPPLPTPEPVPTGQLAGWIIGLIPSDRGLWAMRPDGSQVTLLTDDPIDQLTTSPGGSWGAYLTHNRNGALYEQPFGYTLKLITFRDSRTHPITTIDPPGLSAESPPLALDAAVQAVSAYRQGAMQFSPDGRALAFTSSHEAAPGAPASADIYLYSPTTGVIRRLTELSHPDGPVYAHNLNWSPDGLRIFFNVAYSFGLSGSPEETWQAGAWVVDASGQLTQVPSGENSSGERLIDWAPGSAMLLASRSLLCGDSNLRVFNLRTGQVTALWPGCFTDVVYNQARGELLISVTEELAFVQADTQPGLYLARVYQEGAERIAETGFERLYTGDSRASWYGFTAGQGLFAVFRSGQVFPAFTGPPYDSSNGALHRPLDRLAGTEDWLWSNMESGQVFIARRGGETEPLLFPPLELSGSPAVGGLYFFFTPGETGAQLYGVRARDWQPFLIQDGIGEPLGIYWVP